MRAGRLRHSVVFETPSVVSDGLGAGGTVTWADTLVTRAAIWPIKAAERIEGLRTKMVITHRIRVRYRSSIVPSMRIRHGSRYFDIKAIRNLDEASRELEILATEKI